MRSCAAVAHRFAGHRADTRRKILAVLHQFLDARLQFAVARFEFQLQPRELFRRRFPLDDRAELLRAARPAVVVLLAKFGLRGSQFVAQRLHMRLDAAERFAEVKSTTSSATTLRAGISRSVNRAFFLRLTFTRLSTLGTPLRTRLIDWELFLGRVVLLIFVIFILVVLIFIRGRRGLIVRRCTFCGRRRVGFADCRGRFQDRSDCFGQLRDFVAQGILPLCAPAAPAAITAASAGSGSLSRRSASRAHFSTPSCVTGGCGTVKTASVALCTSRSTSAGFSSASGELREPGFAAADEDIGNDLRILRRQPAGLLVAEILENPRSTTFSATGTSNLNSARARLSRMRRAASVSSFASPESN